MSNTITPMVFDRTPNVKARTNSNAAQLKKECLERCKASSTWPAFTEATVRHFFAKGEKVEARGVEPLSSSLSTQTSTCLSGVRF